MTFYSEEFRIGDGKKTKRQRQQSTKSDDLDATFASTLSSSCDPFMSAISESLTTDDETFYTESSTITNDDEDRDEDSETESGGDDGEGEFIYRSGMVMMGQLLGRQEIRINMKMNENIDGPKVSLQMSIGTITLFLTPRQLHLLFLLCDILLNSNATSSSSGDCETMTEAQGRKTEDKLRTVFGGLMAQQTWSGEDYDCNISDITSARDLHYINTLRPVSSGDSVFSSNSSMSTSIGSSAASQGTSRRKRAIERDQNADISHFNIRIAGLYVSLLHDDILVPVMRARPDESPLNEASVDKMRSKCDYFFKYVSSFMPSCGTSDLQKIGTIMKQACDNNHMRYVAVVVRFIKIRLIHLFLFQNNVSSNYC